MSRKGLGKGLDALLPMEAHDEEKGIKEVKITDIEPNGNQPRKNFDDEKLRQLAESIKQHGVVQPLIVKKENESFKIVAGERRWRAARLAGLSTVPVIIKELTEKQVMEIALIENLQREDLNPIEEAEAFEKLIKEFGMTQEQISSAVGKSRSAVANSLRLLSLCEEIRKSLINGDITSGHARTLLAIENKQIQLKALEEIIRNGLNVRETEKLVKRYLTESKRKTEKKRSPELDDIEDRLKNFFGTKVQLLASKKKGKILIEYYSNDELDRIINLIEKIPGE